MEQWDNGIVGVADCTAYFDTPAFLSCRWEKQAGECSGSRIVTNKTNLGPGVGDCGFRIADSRTDACDGRQQPFRETKPILGSRLESGDCRREAWRAKQSQLRAGDLDCGLESMEAVVTNKANLPSGPDCVQDKPPLQSETVAPNKANSPGGSPETGDRRRQAGDRWILRNKANCRYPRKPIVKLRLGLPPGSGTCVKQSQIWGR
jgi:hypothetical protein